MNKIKWLLVITAACLVPVWAANYVPCQVGMEGYGTIKITEWELRNEEDGEQILRVYAPYCSVITNYEGQARPYKVELVCVESFYNLFFTAQAADCKKKTPDVSYEEGIAVGATDCFTSGMTVNATITASGGYPKTTYYSESDSTIVNF